MTNSTLKIHNIFKFSDGRTVIACDRPADECVWDNRKINIISDDGQQRQGIVISEMRSMLRQTKHLNEIAIETSMPVHLSTEEAQSGRWFVAF
jgi:hypothetical protein